MSGLPAPAAPPGRHIGVMKAGSQTNPEDEKVYGKKNTLKGMLELRTFVLLYHDGSGLQQPPHVVHEFGGKFYSAPSALEWGKSLRELEPWLQDLASRRLAQMEASGTAPADQVDVMELEKGT